MTEIPVQVVGQSEFYVPGPCSEQGKHILDNGLVIRVWCGDITAVEAEAVVAGEDSQFLASGAVAQVLLKVGGKYYQLKRNQIKDMVRREGCNFLVYRCPGGPGLKNKQVIHAILHHGNRSDPLAWSKHLEDVFFQAGFTADNAKVASVAVPLLGAGNTGGNMEVSLQAAVRGLSKVSPTFLGEVILVEFIPEKAARMRRRLEEIVSPTSPDQKSSSDRGGRIAGSGPFQSRTTSSTGARGLPHDIGELDPETRTVVPVDAGREEGKRASGKAGKRRRRRRHSSAGSRQESMHGGPSRSSFYSAGQDPSQLHRRPPPAAGATATPATATAAAATATAGSATSPGTDRLPRDTPSGRSPAGTQRREFLPQQLDAATSHRAASPAAADPAGWLEATPGSREPGLPPTPQPHSTSTASPLSETDRDLLDNLPSLGMTQTKADETPEQRIQGSEQQGLTLSLPTEEEELSAHLAAPPSPEERSPEEQTKETDLKFSDMEEFPVSMERQAEEVQPPAPVSSERDHVQDENTSSQRKRMMERSSLQAPPETPQEETSNRGQRKRMADLGAGHTSGEGSVEEEDNREQRTRLEAGTARPDSTEAPTEEEPTSVQREQAGDHTALEAQGEEPGKDANNRGQRRGMVDKRVEPASEDDAAMEGDNRGQRNQIVDEDGPATSGERPVEGGSHRGQKKKAGDDDPPAASRESPPTQGGNRGQRKRVVERQTAGQSSQAGAEGDTALPERGTTLRAQGTMPPGRMMHFVLDEIHLDGHRDCGVILVDYVIADGVQGPQHPQPGSPYSGCAHRAFLPDNGQGRQVLSLLGQAFERRLTFQVCVEPDGQAVVEWTDIPHKTRFRGGREGYPDPDYLTTVQDVLREKYGIE